MPATPATWMGPHPDSGMTTTPAQPPPVDSAVTRVLIVDDHDLFAESLLLALDVAGFWVQRAPSLDPPDVLAAAVGQRVDVVLLDLQFGGDGTTGLPLVEPLRSAGATVVMVTGVEDPARMGECLEAGACSVVNKSEPLEALIHATREAAAGRSVNPAATRTALLQALRLQRADHEARTERLRRLTPAESEVLLSLCRGLNAEAIAEQRVVSIRTVRSQIESILTKLDVSSQIGAVAIANRAGWPTAGPEA